MYFSRAASISRVAFAVDDSVVSMPRPVVTFRAPRGATLLLLLKRFEELHHGLRELVLVLLLCDEAVVETRLQDAERRHRLLLATCDLLIIPGLLFLLPT